MQEITMLVDWLGWLQVCVITETRQLLLKLTLTLTLTQKITRVQRREEELEFNCPFCVYKNILKLWE